GVRHHLNRTEIGCRVDEPAVNHRHIGVVLDDDDAPPRLDSARGCPDFQLTRAHPGTVTDTVRPPPRGCSISIEPWTRLTMLRTSARPTPAWSDFVVKSRSNMRFASSAGTPGPQSRTRKSVLPFSRLMRIETRRREGGMSETASTAF